MIVPPVMLVPFRYRTPPFVAVSCPAPELVTADCSTSVPPLAACSVPLLATAALTIVIVPPETSAAIVPLLTSALAPPSKFWPPMVPFCPRMVTLGPIVRVAGPFGLSMLSRLPDPVAPNAIVPVPARV